RADSDAQNALGEGKYGFCSQPRRPLSRGARRLCGHAEQIKACKGFAEACAELEEKPKPPPDIPDSGVWRALGSFARVFVWLVVAAVIVAIAIPLIRAILRSRRDKELAEPVAEAKTATPKPPPVDVLTTSDAELLLRRAEEHARRGEHALALHFYLGAALRAPDQRGAIRITKHR